MWVLVALVAILAVYLLPFLVGRREVMRLSNAEVTDAAEPYLDFFLQRYADAYRIELTAFIDAVVAGTKPTPSIDDAIEALRLAEAATESAKTGKPVSLA